MGHLLKTFLILKKGKTIGNSVNYSKKTKGPKGPKGPKLAIIDSGIRF